MRRFARSGAVLTVTRWKGPLGWGVFCVMVCVGVGMAFLVSCACAIPSFSRCVRDSSLIYRTHYIHLWFFL